MKTFWILILFFLSSACSIKPLKKDNDQIYDLPSEETASLAAEADQFVESAGDAEDKANAQKDNMKKKAVKVSDEELESLEDEAEGFVSEAKKVEEEAAAVASTAKTVVTDETDFLVDNMVPQETEQTEETEENSEKSDDGPILANQMKKEGRVKVGPFTRFNPTNYSLIVAAKSGTIESLKRLLDLGLDINFQNKVGDTPLISAVKNKRYGNVKYLLKRGADKDIKNNAGNTPLQLAIENRLQRIIDILQ